MDKLNLLDEKELAAAAAIIPTVKESKFLTLGVFPMKIEAFERLESKEEGIPMLRVIYDTGYPLQDPTKGNRKLNDVFLLYRKEEGKNVLSMEKFSEWAKNTLGIESKPTNELLAKAIGKTVAVATKKDEKGYIAYWYSGKMENYDSMKRNYKAKDESSGHVAQRSESTIPESAPLPEGPAELLPWERP